MATNFKAAWDDIKRVFGLEGVPISSDECLSNETILVKRMDYSQLTNNNLDLLQFLEKNGILKEVVEFLQAEFEARLRLEVVPEFWKVFDQPGDDQMKVVEKANLFCEVKVK